MLLEDDFYRYSLNGYLRSLLTLPTAFVHASGSISVDSNTGFYIPPFFENYIETTTPPLRYNVYYFLVEFRSMGGHTVNQTTVYIELQQVSFYIKWFQEFFGVNPE